MNFEQGLDLFKNIARNAESGEKFGIFRVLEDVAKVVAAAGAVVNGITGVSDSKEDIERLEKRNDSLLKSLEVAHEDNRKSDQELEKYKVALLDAEKGEEVVQKKLDAALDRVRDLQNDLQLSEGTVSELQDKYEVLLKQHETLKKKKGRMGSIK